MSMSCLTRSLGIWNDDDAYTAGFLQGNKDRMANDVRVMLKNGSGELFYAPTADKVQDYGWVIENRALKGHEDWFEEL